MVGAGFPIAFLVIEMISHVGEKSTVLRYIPMFTLFDSDKIISGEGFVPQFLVLIVITIVMYGLGFYVFKKRDLPL